MSIFFFSSRRRHTRLVSDWSSDVCSSDRRLLEVLPSLPREQRVRRAGEDGPGPHRGERRSEERRVGKECGGGGQPSHEKEKKWEARGANHQTPRKREQREDVGEGGRCKHG